MNWLKKSWPQYATILYLGIIVGLVVICYSNTFSSPFLFDDHRGILLNKQIQGESALANALLSLKEGGETTAGRPMVSFSLALNYAIGGENVFGYHLFNLCCHICAALLLYGVVRQTYLLKTATQTDAEVDKRACALAFAITAVWALHPLQTESVTYIVQRAEVMAGLFILGALYGFVRSVRSAKPWRWMVFSAVLCLGGMASKEIAYAIPLLVLLYDRTIISGTFKKALIARPWYYGGLFASWIFLGWLMYRTGQRGQSAGVGLGVSSWDYLLTQCQAIVMYFKLAVWPSPLVFDYGVGLETSLLAVLPQALFLMALFASTIWLVVRKSIFGFLGACFFLILAPSSSFVPIVTQTIAEHRMYLPLAAIVIAVVIGLHRISRQWSYVICGAWVLVLAGLTYARNADYKSAESIWGDTVAKLPSNGRAQFNYANALIQSGKMTDAILHYKDALDYYKVHGSSQTELADIYYNMGNAYAALGNTPFAVESYRNGLSYDQKNADIRFNLGRAFLALGQPNEAVRYFSEGVALQPDAVDLRVGLANALLRSGRGAESVEHYETALRLNDSLAEAHTNLAFAYAQTQRPAKALEHFEAAARLDPNNPVVRTNLGMVLFELDRIDDGIGQIKRALEIDPNYEPAKDIMRQIQELSAQGR